MPSLILKWSRSSGQEAAREAREEPTLPLKTSVVSLHLCTENTVLGTGKQKNTLEHTNRPMDIQYKIDIK